MWITTYQEDNKCLSIVSVVYFLTIGSSLDFVVFPNNIYGKKG